MNANSQGKASNAVSSPSMTRYRQEQDPYRAFLLKEPASTGSSGHRADTVAKGLQDWDKRWASMDNGFNTKKPGDKGERYGSCCPIIILMDE